MLNPIYMFFDHPLFPSNMYIKIVIVHKNIDMGLVYFHDTRLTAPTSVTSYIFVLGEK